MVFLRSYWWVFLLMVIVIIAAIIFIPSDYQKYNTSANKEGRFEWEMPDITKLSSTEAELVGYGKELVANTAYYLGPKGKIASISNGMNCQNCHLQAGTKFLGNNYTAVNSTYPRFRARSGMVENIHKRINDCLERSLNGQQLDSSSLEMQAISAYIKWIGSSVPKKVIPVGAGIADLPFLDRATDTTNGKAIFFQKCSRCHGTNGEGQLNIAGTGYIYPPLWGKHSYNVSAGLFRISRFAGFVKHNMPQDASIHMADTLNNEEAWDVAAFVNSQPRPQKKFPQDWPDISKKPVDHPFGPYTNNFTESQHKYGPFPPMKKSGS
ncbi:MAG: c-type cytochrome [Ferruginibacter sp.]